MRVTAEQQGMKSGRGLLEPGDPRGGGAEQLQRLVRAALVGAQDAQPSGGGDPIRTARGVESLTEQGLRRDQIAPRMLDPAAHHQASSQRGSSAATAPSAAYLAAVAKSRPKYDAHAPTSRASGPSSRHSSTSASAGS